MEEIPEFKAFYSTPKMMNRKQKAFYQFLVSELELGRYPSVDGNISYLFAYTYPILKAWRKKGFGYVHDALMALADAYTHEEHYANYCEFWACDCLLGLGRLEEYLERTVAADSFHHSAAYNDTRSNIYYKFGRPLSFIDFQGLFSWKYKANLTLYTARNLERYWQCFKEEGLLEESANGPWFQRLFDAKVDPMIVERTLFMGAPIFQPYLKTIKPYYNFSTDHEGFIELILKLSRNAENRLREIDHMPPIKEGWVAETELFIAIKEAFPQTKVIQHGRPEWLGRQHLDIWMPDCNIAVEFNGQQHYAPVDFFGGVKAYLLTKERDERKADLCVKNGVRLFVVNEKDSFESVIQRIKSHHELKRQGDLPS